MPYVRDSDELERRIRGYSPIGYRVSVSPLGEGFIEEVIQEYKQRSQYRVRLDKRIKFEEYADMVGAETRKMNVQEIQKLYRGMLPPFPEELLERGMSRQDILRIDLERTGCLDEQGSVPCIIADWSQLYLTEIESGMFVEYSEGYATTHVEEGTGGIRVWAGQVVGAIPASKNPEGKWPIVLLEAFEPVTYYRTPQGINNLVIKKGFYSQKAVVLAYGIVEAMEDFEKETGGQIMPKEGRWSDDRKEYFLDQPMDLKVIEKFCKQNYPNEIHCLLQAMLMFIIPINIGERGTFKPLRRGDIEDYVKAIQFEYDF